MKYPTRLTKRDTPAAKRTVQPPPIERSEVEEEPEGDKTHPMPEGWFKDRDQLYGQST